MNGDSRVGVRVGLACAALLCVPARAEIEVPPGFAVDVLLDQLDGATPRLETIRNPDYGFGVVAASVDNGILSVLRISQSSVELIGNLSGFAGNDVVRTVRFDHTGIPGLDQKLFVAVSSTNQSSGNTHIIRVESNGTRTEVAHLGGSGNSLEFVFDFTSGTGGYLPGAYLEDVAMQDGTSLWHMDAGYAGTALAGNLVPPGRTDLDVSGVEFDLSGTYGFHFHLADCDANNDNLSVIYKLLPDLTWEELTAPVNTQTRCYRDIAISPGGTFGDSMYVADSVSQTILTSDVDGNLSVFASGFDGVWSVSISADGDDLFASDDNGIYRIRSTKNIPGPTIVVRAPQVTGDDVHTGASGVSSERIVFNEPVIFDANDVTITDADAAPVPFAVAGSNSQFMLISFGEALLNGVFTITIGETVVSAVTGAPIDGDDDGEAGGPAVIVMEHRCRTDSDNSGETAFGDILEVLSNWGSCSE